MLKREKEEKGKKKKKTAAIFHKCVVLLGALGTPAVGEAIGTSLEGSEQGLFVRGGGVGGRDHFPGKLN